MENKYHVSIGSKVKRIVKADNIKEAFSKVISEFEEYTVTCDKENFLVLNTKKFENVPTRVVIASEIYL